MLLAQGGGIERLGLFVEQVHFELGDRQVQGPWCRCRPRYWQGFADIEYQRPYPAVLEVELFLLGDDFCRLERDGRLVEQIQFEFGDG
ncbi:hypothetical protein D3C75_1232050 [compost metagenome]